MTSLERPAQSAIRQYAERRSQAEAQLACVTKAFQKEGVRGSRSTYSLQVSTIKGHIQESRPDVRNLCFGLLGPPFSAVNMEKQLRIKLAASSKPFCQSGKDTSHGPHPLGQLASMVHVSGRRHPSTAAKSPGSCKADGARCISPLSLLHLQKMHPHLRVNVLSANIEVRSSTALEVATHWLMARKVQLFFSFATCVVALHQQPRHPEVQAVTDAVQAVAQKLNTKGCVLGNRNVRQ